MVQDRECMWIGASGSIVRNETDQAHVMHVLKDGMTLSFSQEPMCVSVVNISQTCPGTVHSTYIVVSSRSSRNSNV